MIKLIKHIALIGLAAVLAGCSLLKKETPAAELPQASVPLYPVVAATPENDADALSGKWFVRSVGTMTLSGIEDDEWPYLDFVSAELRFYGCDGCNILNGDYSVSSGNVLTISHLASTMRLCEADSLSYPMQSALNSVGSFAVSKSNDGTTLLTLKSRNDKVIMTLSKSDIDFLNGAWQVTAINGKQVNVPEMRLIFDVIDGHISGNAGCNSVRGDVARNPMVENSLHISNLITTRRACPNLSSETALLIALEEVVAAKPDGKDNVKLLDAAGKTSVMLQRLTRNDF